MLICNYLEFIVNYVLSLGYSGAEIDPTIGPKAGLLRKKLLQLLLQGHKPATFPLYDTSCAPPNSARAGDLAVEDHLPTRNRVEEASFSSLVRASTSGPLHKALSSPPYGENGTAQGQNPHLFGDNYPEAARAVL